MIHHRFLIAQQHQMLHVTNVALIVVLSNHTHLFVTQHMKKFNITNSQSLRMCQFEYIASVFVIVALLPRLFLALRFKNPAARKSAHDLWFQTELQ